MGKIRKEQLDLSLTGWISPTFQNSWVNFGAEWDVAGYCKDALGFVHLKGLIKSGTLNTACFTLPVSYRPAAAMHFSAASNSLFGVVRIYPNGEVKCGNPGANDWFALNNISFKAEL